MRIALLSDIHGNATALDAVLADIEVQGGVDAYWVLGDLVALGPDPAAVLERLVALPNTRFARGNSDRYLVTGERPRPRLEEARADPALLPILIEVTGSFAWTQGALTAAGWFGWLADLPLELREVLPDGTRVLGAHAAPGADDGAGIHPAASAEELRALISGSCADLICVGHTHLALDVRVDGTRVVNLGSVSMPIAPDARASYVLLEADESGYEIRHQRVDYDRRAVIERLERIGHPGAGFIRGFLEGRRASRRNKLVYDWDRLVYNVED